MLTKICTNCGLALNIDKFNKHKNRYDGLQVYCKSCMREKSNLDYLNKKDGYHTRTKSRRAERYRLLLDIRNVACMDCKIKYNPIIMEFDHLQDKTAMVSSLTTCSIDTILKEVSKCEIVCGNCHSIRTAARRPRKSKYSGEYKFINELKLKSKCLDCNKSYPSCCMEFDHVPERGQKLFKLSKLPKGITHEQVLTEIQKCDIVCSNCHMLRTMSR